MQTSCSSMSVSNDTKYAETSDRHLVNLARIELYRIPMLHSNKLNLGRKYDLPNLEQGTERSHELNTAACTGVLLILLYESVETGRTDDISEAGS
jgi:hypothetical protein